MKRLETFVVYCFVIMVLLITNLAIAAPVSQIITLKPGWNAVFFEVEPADSDPAVVFSAVADLTSVWAWNSRVSTIEFIFDPGTLVPEQEGMLAYFPSNALVTNLHAIHGGTAYLIQLSGTTDAVLTVMGEPAIPDIDWKPDSLNFVGFHLAGAYGDAGPFLADFFSSSPAHEEQDIYLLDNASNTWVLASPSDQMRKGEAFWIRCNGSSEFNGSIHTQLQQGSGINYGTALDEQELLVKNDSNISKIITLTPSSGTVPLFYYQFDPATQLAQWVALGTGSPLNLTIPGGSNQRLRLGVKRAGLTADVDYVTNLDVTDGEGVRFLLPVSVTGISNVGLWTGFATTTKVNQPALDVDSDIPLPTGSPFSFRLLLHHDVNNQTRLLQNVIQMWQEGGWLPDPNNLGYQIVDPDNRGTFVLLSDDSLIDGYKGAALRDGRPVARRISSSAFAFDTPRTLTGNFQNGGVLTVSLADPPAAVHPFRHQYHKSHRDAGLSITREITLTFSDMDADGNPIPGSSSLNWGSFETGGIYAETISGLHRETLHTQGTFLLRRVSNVQELTTP